MLPGRHIYEMQEAVRNGKEVDVSQIIRRMRSSEPAQRHEEEGGISDLGDVIALPHVEKAAGQRQMPHDPQPGLRRPQPVMGGGGAPATSAGYAARDYAAPRSSFSSPPVAEVEQRPAGGNSLINAFRTRN